MYTLNITFPAKKNIAYFKKNGGNAVTNQIEKLQAELIQFPKTRTGQVEQLKGDRQCQWSRRIDKKNRLVYLIDDEIVRASAILFATSTDGMASPRMLL